MDLVGILRAEGLTVDDHRRAPAPGPFDPVGIIDHHTASRPPDPVPSLSLVRNGGSNTAPGPLCGVLIGRDLIVRVITDGRSNHAGLGSRLVLARIRAGLPALGDARQFAPVSDTNGNPWFFGVEIENDGVGEPWPDELVTVSCRVNAAICRVHDWSADRVLLHREWTARKIDPNHADGATWRRITADLLDPPLTMPVPDPPPPEEDDMPHLMLRDTRDGTIWAVYAGGSAVHLGPAAFMFYEAKSVPLKDCAVEAGAVNPHAEADRLRAQAG